MYMNDLKLVTTILVLIIDISTIVDYEQNHCWFSLSQLDYREYLYLFKHDDYHSCFDN